MIKTSHDSDNPVEQTPTQYVPDLYSHSWEYLQDALHLLDLRIQIQLIRFQQQRPEDPLQQFRGLVITETEVASFFSEQPEPDTPEYQSLLKEFERVSQFVEYRRQLSLSKGRYLSLPWLASQFQLTRFEEQCLILCLAAELNPKYEKLYAYLQDDVAKKKPTVNLALNLFFNTTEDRWMARSVFETNKPLLRFLLHIGEYPSDSPSPLITRFLKLEERVVDFLLEHNGIDRRLVSIAEIKAPEKTGERLTDEALLTRITRYLSMDSNRTTIFYCYGPQGSGRKTLVGELSQSLGAFLLRVNLEEVLASEIPYTEILTLIGREIILHQAILCLEHVDLLVTAEDPFRLKLQMLFKFLAEFRPLAFLLGRNRWQMPLPKNIELIEVPLLAPDDYSRKEIWKKIALKYPLASEVSLSEIAGKFRFTPGQMEAAFNTAATWAGWNNKNQTNTITRTALHRACQFHSGHEINNLAKRIEPRYSWEQLVLPDNQTEQLRELCDQVKYRQRVYGEWGFENRFSLGKGMNTLFLGAPGTGKTMAAEVIANELGLAIYKIDLSQVVSKYIGETEKNLSRIFVGAEASNAILFFDEADALFGKRSEVKDAHDRYANIETGYLLQRMEEYSGVVILATNLSKNMDEAFLRRLHFLVELPFPDAQQRELIWRGIFPPEAPLDPGLDFPFLAERLKIAGGNIKNIALTAAFYAAKEGVVIRMTHLMRAVKRECRKIGKSFLKSDFEPYYELAERK